jgi:hypothetical protein
MSPAEQHGPSRLPLTSEHPQDNTTERHLRDLREASDDRHALAKRAPHESPAAGVGATTSGSPAPGAGSEPPMSSRNGG